MTRAARRSAGCAAALVLVLAGCSGTVDGSGRAASGSSPATSSAPSGGAPAAPSASSPAGNGGDSAAACPSRYVAPDPKRPRVSLSFTLAADHRTVRGVEQVTFTPDRPIDEFVFRLTANTRPSVEQGNRISIQAASAAPAGGRFTFSPANADPGTQGGLLRIPLGQRVPAGGTATARVAFTLTLGDTAFDRFGRAGEFAYFGSGQPLLAWERGYGWHTEDMLDFTAESATSEAADTELSVTAPAADVVIASGNPADPPRGSGPTRTWTSRLAAARDVSVAAGPFVVADTSVDGVALRVGAASPAVRDRMVPEFRRAISELAARFGPYPFPSLAVAQLPAGGGGIEYPGSILMLDDSRLVAVHETAHQWFYAMVGDSQSRDPWLDEAFASYAQELVDDAPAHAEDLRGPGRVGDSTQSYGVDESGYYFTTYDKGSAALAAARQAAGASRFDAAIRCYVAKNAWRIAVPADLRAALSGLPAAIRVLERAGALR